MPAALLAFAALLLVACGANGDSRDASDALQRLDAYEAGDPALVFVYTDG
ncbi:MAG: hypothetical protein U5Q44_07145 [Dehalococcoidia bacterium]|nr:hypothetical protein [Dehalococcoidia bacterium]